MDVRSFGVPARRVPPQVTVGDPTEGMLDSPAGRVVEARSGDLCSLLGIVGAATLVINHRGPKSAAAELVGGRIVTGSMAAATLDTAIQARNVLKDRGEGAHERGNQRSTLGTIAYAATGIIPAVSIGALQGFHRHPSGREVAALAVLGLNGAVLGYELVTRGPDMVRGEESMSGYGSALASLGGFVVAHRYLMRRP